MFLPPPVAWGRHNRFSEDIANELFACCTAGMTSFTSEVPATDLLARTQPVVDLFYSAVGACGRTPRFEPDIRRASSDGATRYDPAERAIVLVPYEALNPDRRAAMDRFAAIGTLGLSIAASASSPLSPEQTISGHDG